MSATNNGLPQLADAASGNPVRINEILDALSQCAVFGRNPNTTTGLTWGWLGGSIEVDGVHTAIAASTLLLTASQTNYVERTRAGAVSANIAEFNAGRVPLYTVVAGASSITSYVDHRRTLNEPGVAMRLSKSVAGATDVTLTAAEARCLILTLTGVLTGNISVVVPDGPQMWIVSNGTTGAFSLTVKTDAGSGTAVVQGTNTLLMADGTNVSGMSLAAGTGGSVATDAIWDAAGDIVVGTGANTAARLAIGTALQVLRTNAGATTVEWGPPVATTVQSIQIACSDEITALVAGTAKATFRMPFGFTLSAVRASLTTAQASGSIFTVDVNEDGGSILSTKITIDNTEKTSTTAATAPIISDTALVDDAEMSIDIVQIGDGTAKGLKVTLVGTKV